jgi:phosphoserine phosphatase RsbU/P
LLSVSVMNVLKNRAMPEVDFADPAAVLEALNRTFSMESQNNMFFTIWYGVLSLDTQDLAYACGGHPPAVLLAPGSAEPKLLRASGAIVGGFPECRYESARVRCSPGSRLYVFSDGVYELARPDGSTVQLEEFVAELSQLSKESKLDEIVEWAAGIRIGGKFEDDLSVMELMLP